MATPTAELADIKLGEEGPLSDFVARLRADGCSWRSVAAELYKATDGAVSVSYETLRVWHPEQAL